MPLSPDSDDTQDPDVKRQWDPVFLSSRREARVICLIFVLMLSWTMGASYALGYNNEGDVSLMLGMPRWVVIGVFIPWIIANGVVCWFCFRYMKDDPLEKSEGGEDIKSEEGD